MPLRYCVISIANHAHVTALFNTNHVDKVLEIVQSQAAQADGIDTDRPRLTARRSRKTVGHGVASPEPLALRRSSRVRSEKPAPDTKIEDFPLTSSLFANERFLRDYLPPGIVIDCLPTPQP